MARNQKQNEQMRDLRKEKIRSAALFAFASKGFFATRIQDIAASAEMAQGLLYHYYTSKDAIFVDLIGDAFDKTIAAAEMVRDRNESVREKLLFSLERLLETIETSERYVQTCRLIAQATNSTATPEDVQRLIKEKNEIPYTIMAGIMEEGQREGSVVSGEPMQLAILFWTSINGLAIYRATHGESSKLPDYRMIAPLFLRGEETEKD